MATPDQRRQFLSENFTPAQILAIELKAQDGGMFCTHQTAYQGRVVATCDVPVGGDETRVYKPACVCDFKKGASCIRGIAAQIGLGEIGADGWEA